MLRFVGQANNRNIRTYRPRMDKYRHPRAVPMILREPTFTFSSTTLVSIQQRTHTRSYGTLIRRTQRSCQIIDVFCLCVSISYSNEVSSISANISARIQTLLSPACHFASAWVTRDACRGMSHKVGPAAKVGPCPVAVVHNGTSNFS